MSDTTVLEKRFKSMSTSGITESTIIAAILDFVWSSFAELQLKR